MRGPESSPSSRRLRNDPRVYFGLGAAERVDDVVIIWPDGAAQTVGWFAVDQIVELRRNKSRYRSE